MARPTGRSGAEGAAAETRQRRPLGFAAGVGLLAVAVALGVVLPAVAPAAGRISPSLSSAPHIAVLRGGLGAGADGAALDGGVAVQGTTVPGGATASRATGAQAAGVAAGGAVVLALLVAGPAGALPPDERAEVAAQDQGRLDCVLAGLAARCGPDGVMEPAAPLVMGTYQVRAGDTLYTIAAQFGLHFGTLWWANKLSDPRTLHIGQTLRIPPVDGVVYTFKAGDTIDSVAARYGVSAADIIEFNALTGDDLPVGTTIMVPDASGPPLPKPKTAPVTTASRSAAAPTGSTVGRGTWLWPVPGGWISQYYHASHPALDIAAPMGRTVIAAAAGKVIFAGWKDNGGGYQVWVSHGHDLSTTYNHMELVSVRVGQYVAAGQQVGRVGMTGNATGPHCHFEVWIGPIWNGGYRVNPLNYVR